MDWRIMPIRFRLLLRDPFLAEAWGSAEAQGSGRKAIVAENMVENEISGLAIDICIRIHKQYGPGLFESVYEEIFCHEWDKTGIYYVRQHPIPVIHENIRMEAGFRADLIIQRKVIIEFKSIEILNEVHFKQVLTYLKLTNLKLGLLINFNVPLMKSGIHRIVNKL